MARDEIKGRVMNAARILELGELLERKPRELSGGQRQRVAMGRCIVREPKVFLFDEPLSNLDAKLRVQMRLEIRKLHEDLKVTSIYVTHDQVEAMTLGDRLIVMDSGYSAQIGTPMEVYEKPANTFVAGFIGSPSMNFLDALVSDDGAWAGLPAGVRLELGGMAEQRGKKVILGIRPEHFEVVAEERSKMLLVVDQAEILGADTLVHGHLGEEKAFLTVRLPAVHHLQKSERLPLSVRSRDLHVFDQTGGQRIDGQSGRDQESARKTPRHEEN
jgi:sn-glycerol 3-phosphate transport system ATP-binding protein